MAPPRLIGDYLAELAAQLPAPIVAELADGLDQTRRRYLDQGLSADAAAAAAVAEFGDPRVVIAAFTRASPARRAARRLLATGPLVGACWGAALILNRAWTWPVLPIGARILIGAALITVIGLLAAAAFGRRYRPAAHGRIPSVHGANVNCIPRCTRQTALDVAPGPDTRRGSSSHGFTSMAPHRGQRRRHRSRPRRLLEFVLPDEHSESTPVNSRQPGSGVQRGRYWGLGYRRLPGPLMRDSGGPPRARAAAPR
jgi:hypothetical protein